MTVLAPPSWTAVSSDVSNFDSSTTAIEHDAPARMRRIFRRRSILTVNGEKTAPAVLEKPSSPPPRRLARGPAGLGGDHLAGANVTHRSEPRPVTTGHATGSADNSASSSSTSTLRVHFVSDIAIFVLKRDVKLQLTN